MPNPLHSRRRAGRPGPRHPWRQSNLKGRITGWKHVGLWEIVDGERNIGPLWKHYRVPCLIQIDGIMPVFPFSRRSNPLNLARGSARREWGWEARTSTHAVKRCFSRVSYLCPHYPDRRSSGTPVFLLHGHGDPKICLWSPWRTSFLRISLTAGCRPAEWVLGFLGSLFSFFFFISRECSRVVAFVEEW